jgi:hypothetical protein
MMLSRQDEFWNLDSAKRWGETFEGHPLSWELAGPNGAHYHLWFPSGTPLPKIRDTFARLRNHQDLVSGSYSFL